MDLNLTEKESSKNLPQIPVEPFLTPLNPEFPIDSNDPEVTIAQQFLDVVQETLRHRLDK